MSGYVAKEHPMGDIELRKVFCETLLHMAKEDERVVVLDADLMNAGGTKPFRAAYPDRTFDCGVQEANMIGVAAGLSSRGLVPFTHTFGPFATRRVCDQVFMSCAYARLNVKIVGSDPGVTAALNGGTHMPFEDMGIMRAIPEMTVAEPCDAVSLAAALRSAKDTYGTWYIRLHRKAAPVIYEDGAQFTVGRANLLREGTDVTIMAIGYPVAEALKAADMLAAEGIQARVLDMWCLKPLDTEAVRQAAEQTGAIVTAENHSIYSGLGAAVSLACALGTPVPVEMVGVDEEFGEVGPQDYLVQRFKLTADEIVGKAKKAISRKGTVR